MIDYKEHLYELNRKIQNCIKSAENGDISFKDALINVSKLSRESIIGHVWSDILTWEDVITCFTDLQKELYNKLSKEQQEKMSKEYCKRIDLDEAMMIDWVDNTINALEDVTPIEFFEDKKVLLKNGTVATIEEIECGNDTLHLLLKDDKRMKIEAKDIDKFLE